MNVRELIQELLNYDLNATVIIYHCKDCGGNSIQTLQLEDEGNTKWVVINR